MDLGLEGKRDKECRRVSGPSDYDTLGVGGQDIILRQWEITVKCTLVYTPRGVSLHKGTRRTVDVQGKTTSVTPIHVSDTSSTYPFSF